MHKQQNELSTLLFRVAELTNPITEEESVEYADSWKEAYTMFENLMLLRANEKYSVLNTDVFRDIKDSFSQLDVSKRIDLAKTCVLWSYYQEFNGNNKSTFFLPYNNELYVQRFEASDPYDTSNDGFESMLDLRPRKSARETVGVALYAMLHSAYHGFDITFTKFKKFFTKEKTLQTNVYVSSKEPHMLEPVLASINSRIDDILFIDPSVSLYDIFLARLVSVYAVENTVYALKRNIENFEEVCVRKLHTENKFLNNGFLYSLEFVDSVMHPNSYISIDTQVNYINVFNIALNNPMRIYNCMGDLLTANDISSLVGLANELIAERFIGLFYENTNEATGCIDNLTLRMSGRFSPLINHINDKSYYGFSNMPVLPDVFSTFIASGKKRTEGTKVVLGVAGMDEFLLPNTISFEPSLSKDNSKLKEIMYNFINEITNPDSEISKNYVHNRIYNDIEALLSKNSNSENINYHGGAPEIYVRYSKYIDSGIDELVSDLSKDAFLVPRYLLQSSNLSDRSMYWMRNGSNYGNAQVHKQMMLRLIDCVKLMNFDVKSEGFDNSINLDFANLVSGIYNNIANGILNSSKNVKPENFLLLQAIYPTGLLSGNTLFSNFNSNDNCNEVNTYERYQLSGTMQHSILSTLRHYLIKHTLEAYKAGMISKSVMGEEILTLLSLDYRYIDYATSKVDITIFNRGINRFDYHKGNNITRDSITFLDIYTNLCAYAKFIGIDIKKDPIFTSVNNVVASVFIHSVLKDITYAGWNTLNLAQDYIGSVIVNIKRAKRIKDNDKESIFNLMLFGVLTPLHDACNAFQSYINNSDKDTSLVKVSRTSYSTTSVIYADTYPYKNDIKNISKFIDKNSPGYAHKPVNI